MAPLITLYILGGCVAVAAILFVVMIVLSVARPPRLPPLSIDSPPLERMIRALTPTPFATAGFDAASPKPARTLPPPPPVPAHVQARAMAPAPVATAPAFTPPVVAPPVEQPAPAFTPPAIAPQVPARLDHVQRGVRRPVYPVHRPRKLRRFVIGLVLVSALAAGALVAYPAMLDPLCDDYVWFGDDAAQIVRERALAAHDAIADFIATL